MIDGKDPSRENSESASKSARCGRDQKRERWGFIIR